MKIKSFLFFLMFIVTSQCFSQCFAPTTLFASNINYYSAEVNWDTTSGTYFYRIRYKIIGVSNWSFQNNIDSTLNIKLLTSLTPLSNYIWQIKSYCDNTGTLTSGWSITDTFTTITNTCPNTNILFTTNINYNNATANWDTIADANRYKIRYRILGTSLWSNLGPIYHPEDSITIPLLQQNTSYEWQVLTFHDTSSLLGSLWSVSDTFTTPLFILSSFNPIVSNTLSNLECDVSTEFSLKVTQAENEPDIGTSIITSDGGYFNIGALNTGDSIGYAIIVTTTQSIDAVLKAESILGQNYAIISSYDNSGSLIGFFTIENTTVGIKVSTTTPNDGNNTTSGYVSEIHFTNLFVNPPIAGPLYFFVDIKSELNDQLYDTDTVQIWCNTNSTIEQQNQKDVIGFYDVLGRKTYLKSPKLLFIQFSDGSFEKRLMLTK